MSTLDVYPYYYPTTVYIVDDNMDFLTNFSLQLDEKLAYRLYNSPNAALKEVNHKLLASRTAQTSLYRHIGGTLPRKQYNSVELDMFVFAKDIRNPSRFAENSVIIVDYDMPGIDGISFCRLIDNPCVQKILISGVADEKIAVEAFNEGIIDKFVLKGSDEKTKLVNDYITESQNAYFKTKTAPVISAAISGGLYDFLRDDKFAAMFREMRQRHSIAEYYLTTDPCGFLMINATGDLFFLLIFTLEEFNTHADIIQDQHGPAELYNLVKERSGIPLFDSADGYYTPEVQNWRSYVYPVEKLQGTGIHYTLIENPSFYNDISGHVYYYDKYLESLDYSLRKPH
ncbi:MAG: response regulator [Methylococcaceae bacterium]|nr:MAG: response regulator [Methylococcaceae bacterium]